MMEAASLMIGEVNKLGYLIDGTEAVSIKT